MIDMLKRHEIQVLRRAEHTYQEIATLTGVPARTVRRIAAESAVTAVAFLPVTAVARIAWVIVVARIQVHIGLSLG